MDEIITKKCRKCGEIRDIREFRIWRLVCKLCQAKDSKNYRIVHKSRIAVREKQYRLEHKSEAKLARKQWWIYHGKERNTCHKKWYLFHKNERRIYNKQYNKEHRDENRIRTHVRRSRQAENGGKYTRGEWQLLCGYYSLGGRCLCCGEVKPLVTDHVVPIKLGGTSDISNLQPICNSCNCSKQAKYIDYRPDGGAFALLIPIFIEFKEQREQYLCK